MLSHLSRRRPFLAKTVTYRLLSVVTTVLVAYALLGDPNAALDVGLATSAVKMGVYYAHERAWDAAEPPVTED